MIHTIRIRFVATLTQRQLQVTAFPLDAVSVVAAYRRMADMLARFHHTDVAAFETTSQAALYVARVA